MNNPETYLANAPNTNYLFIVVLHLASEQEIKHDFGIWKKKVYFIDASNISLIYFLHFT